MPKYQVRVRLFEPTIYEIEAVTKSQAARKGVKRYIKEHDSWLKPKVEEVLKIT